MWNLFEVFDYAPSGRVLAPPVRREPESWLRARVDRQSSGVFYRDRDGVMRRGEPGEIVEVTATTLDGSRRLQRLD